MRVAVVQFPGSNCDEDTVRANQLAGAETYLVWHRETDLQRADAVMIPGGFAYGDYLRAGAIARFSPIMGAVKALADAGGPVLGICNGFQVLCEAGLLPGALLRNRGQRFVARPITVRVESAETPFTSAFRQDETFDVPVAHGEGRFVAAPDVLDELESSGSVVLRYVNFNPNGSVNDIAGVSNPARNVVGIMPHPERAAEAVVGLTGGAKVFRSLVRGAPIFEGGSV